jgi:hypothetical protein
MSMGYVWPLYNFDIYRAARDGSAPRAIAASPRYDAEATVCAVDGSIVFTSDRDGDLELYRMDADGANLRRLTHTPGYDGGAFFSPDCSKIVWRASRPTGKGLEEYQSLLERRLVRPSQLELFVANADGTDARQITYLGAASFAPFFHPSGNRVLFSSNYPSPRGREFEIWAVNTDGTALEQITHSAGFDGFPMFSPDGTQLVFASNRRDVEVGADGAPRYRITGTAQGDSDTNLFVADWVEHPPAIQVSTADRIRTDILYLADDARAGRAVGSSGLEAATAYVEAALGQIGVTPGMPGETYRQPFEVTTAVDRGPGTRAHIDGVAVPSEDFVPLALSGSGPVRAQVVHAGWGISAPELGHDDYRGLQVKGKIVVVHRFTPTAAPFDQPAAQQKYGDLAYKAFSARQRGAVGIVIIDDGNLEAAEASLPSLQPRTGSDAGLAAVVMTRKAAAALGKASTVELAAELRSVRTTTSNLIGVIRAGAGKPGAPAIVIGAHLDHLGQGGAASLDRAPGIHNGADDNASGVAALLAVARDLVARRGDLQRDVWIVAFSAEEMGVIGSSHFVKNSPISTGVAAMLNLDMVGRMRGNQLQVIGSDSADEWRSIVEPACDAVRVRCSLGGSGYGPSDHMSFYMTGVPVLHLFTGSHLDYHRASDDAATINTIGVSKVAQVVSAVTTALARDGTKLSYKKVAPEAAAGDRRGVGASLGTIPSYNQDVAAPPGVVLSDVVPEGPAAKAGARGGDRIVRIGSTEIRNIGDLMFVLSSAQPGTPVEVTVMRDDKPVVLRATYGQPRSRR